MFWKTERKLTIGEYSVISKGTQLIFKKIKIIHVSDEISAISVDKAVEAFRERPKRLSHHHQLFHAEKNTQKLT
jgi:hypothetical protein